MRSIATGGGKTEYTPIGHTTNLASRMQAVANPVRLPSVRRYAQAGRRLFRAQAAGPDKDQRRQRTGQRVRGDWTGTAAHAAAALGRRGLTKFVGREREMEALRHALSGASTGHGQIVAAMAEAGVGKSRLFFEFKAKNQSGWMVLETFSVSHGKASAYFPVIDLLHGYFRIAAEDDASTRREKVNGRIVTLDRRWKIRCRTCSVCSESSRATTRWRRWTVR